MKQRASTRVGEGPLHARVLVESAEIERFAEQLGREHFLGARRASGDALYQVVVDPEGRWCGLLLWCSAALCLQDRDEWIGWDPYQRSQRLKLVVNNARFLVPESARRPNLASRVLAVATAALPAQMEAVHGYRPVLAETFTDPRLHVGTCYRAAGWTAVGQSAGYGRHRADFFQAHGAAKCIWVKALQPDARAVLGAAQVPQAQRAALTTGTEPHRVLGQPARRSLREALRSIPDPRSRKGQQYPAPALLTVICMGLLSGCGQISQIHRLGERMSDAERRAIGFRRRQDGYPPPGYHVYWHLLRQIDLEALASALTTWLQEHAGTLPRHLALDGKDVRKSIGMIVTLADAETGIPVALKPAPGKGHELKAAQALIADPAVRLEGMIVTADALHCQKQTAHLLAQERGAHYILQVKGNQPAIQDVARFAVPQDTPFLP
jgi:hypothetical protein